MNKFLTNTALCMLCILIQVSCSDIRDSDQLYQSTACFDTHTNYTPFKDVIVVRVGSNYAVDSCFSTSISGEDYLDKSTNTMHGSLCFKPKDGLTEMAVFSFLTGDWNPPDSLHSTCNIKSVERKTHAVSGTRSRGKQFDWDESGIAFLYDLNILIPIVPTKFTYMHPLHKNLNQLLGNEWCGSIIYAPLGTYTATNGASLLMVEFEAVGINTNKVAWLKCSGHLSIDTTSCEVTRSCAEFKHCYQMNINESSFSHCAHIKTTRKTSIKLRGGGPSILPFQQTAHPKQEISTSKKQEKGPQKVPIKQAKSREIKSKKASGADLNIRQTAPPK